MAKPFLKWAGGKTQLIEQIEKSIPDEFYTEAFTYVEPFAGSAAVFFWMQEKFPNMQHAILNDVNKELIDCYKEIKDNVDDLINILKLWELEYHAFDDKTELKKEYYYHKRGQFNSRESSRVMQSALFVFLNRTCFNGLYRVNKKNQFNVPIGSYKKPQICNISNLKAISLALQNVTLLSGDYQETLKYADNSTLFYLDPPYKPLSQTSSFNSYAKDVFDDNEQIRLQEFCQIIDKKEQKWILSNSDTKNVNPEDNFFDDLYDMFNIQRVFAKRNINSNSSKRGQITELLITN